MSTYDQKLLAEAPAATKRDRQEGYNIDLLQEPSRRSETPPVGSRQTAPLVSDPEAGAQPRHYAASKSKSTPFFRTTRGIALIVIVLLIIIGAVVGGAVGGTVGKKHNNNTTSPGSGGGGGDGASSVTAAPTTGGGGDGAGAHSPTMTGMSSVATPASNSGADG